ncbi:SGNH/GDSL hydrolase family protein [Rhodococcus rhodochrous]|uniref:Lysophospholipase L1-like esterase n=1 Tax=Rhodococcus rhodochrous J45 TaxID=935266 RepID=A0A562DM06_RHORH|nr:SGNH/GDSL hydrolase family protein [Rhodococcus rhodochrous]TWH10701.1 lysophospholipase L1-like esterase [Rhodococcus rhodochrous J45]
MNRTASLSDTASPNGEFRSELDDPMVLTPQAAREMMTGMPWSRFAVIGDSIAAGTGDPWPGYAEVPWADRVASTMRSVRPEVAYLNTGAVGATIGEVLSGQMGAVLDFGPDLVHVNCGGNDLFLHNAGIGSVERDLDELCAAVTAGGARLSMFTLADAFTGPMLPLRPRFVEFADVVRRVARRHDAILTEFWDHPARLRRNWLSADRIHLTMAGHAVVASEVTRSLARFGDGAA